MKRTFADLHLRVNPKDHVAAQRLINKAAKFGYHFVSFTFGFELLESQLVDLKDSCSQAGLDFVYRADFKPRNQEDLMRFIRKFRRKLEVICIICDNKEIARQAAKDRRVDLLNFPSLDYHKRFFDRAEAELASCSQTALEVDIKPLMIMEGPPRVRLLSSLRREVALAREFHIPIVVSSGVGEDYLMRMPRNLASIAYLFGLNETEALDAVSTNPAGIIIKNRDKMNSAYIAPGISVLKEGQDP